MLKQLIISMNKKNEINKLITKNELLKYFIFSDEIEEEHCSIYLDLKGIGNHVLIANEIGLNETGKIEYKKVSDLYRYDKRLRIILYKFIAALEEQIRGFISNNYVSKQLSEESIKALNKNMDKNDIYEGLKNLSFNKLTEKVQLLNKNERKMLFPNVNDDYLKKNLKAVVELRNAISHHRLILFYKEYKVCNINSKDDNDILHNILNLYNLINEYHQEFLKDNINNAINYDNDNTETKSGKFKIDEKYIIKI